MGEVWGWRRGWGGWDWSKCFFFLFWGGRWVGVGGGLK